MDEQERLKLLTLATVLFDDIRRPLMLLEIMDNLHRGTLTEIAGRVGERLGEKQTPSTIRWHLSKLIERDMVKKVSNKYYEITDTGSQIIEVARPSYSKLFERDFPLKGKK